MPPRTNRREEWDSIETVDEMETAFADLMRAERERQLRQAREEMELSRANAINWWTMPPIATTGHANNIPQMTVRPGTTRRVMNDGSVLTTSDGQPVISTRHPGRRITSNDVDSVTVSDNGRGVAFESIFDVEFPQPAPRGERPSRGKRHLSRGDRQMLHNPALDDKKIDDLVVSDLF